MSLIPYKKVGQSNSGWMSEDLAMFSYVLRHHLLETKGNWDEETHDEQVRWDRFMTKAIQEIDEAIEKQEVLSFRGLAMSCFDWYTAAGTTEAWEAMPLRERLAWEAIARNLVNCLDSRLGDVKIEEACQRWFEWIERKLSE